MKNLTRRTLLLALSLALLMTVLPSSLALADETETLSIFVTNQGRTWKEDSPANIEMQRRLGFNLDVDIAEPQSDRFNMMVASGELPDMCFVPGMNFLEYLSSGYFMQLDELIEEYGPELKAHIAPEIWKLVEYDDHYYCIPDANMGSKYLTHIRQDWLDSLGLEMPKTLDDFTEVLRAFTLNDPDKNGENDTYGLGNGTGSDWVVNFMMIFGAFNGIPGQSYAYGDKILPYALSDDFRAALTYINGLWAENLIDPEMFILKEAQARQKMVQGIAGVFNGWWSISSQTFILSLHMNELDPNVNWVPIKPVLTNNEGVGGMRDQGSITGTWLVSADSKHPELAVKLLNYLISDEGYYLALYGIEGQDYTMENGFVYRTESGQQAYNEFWLDPLQQFVRRQDILNLQQNSPTDNVDELRPRPFRNYVNSGTIPLYTDVFYGLPATEAKSEYGASLDSYIEQMAIEFITGQRELTDENWNNYIAGWKQRNGVQVLKAEVEQLNQTKGTAYSVGIE